MELVMPNSYVEVTEEEMMYLDGGDRFYNLTGLFELIAGAGTGASAVYKSVKKLWTVTSAAVKTALKSCVSGIVGYVALVYYAAQIALACTYLNRNGSYQVKGIGIGSWQPISYVTE